MIRPGAIYLFYRDGFRRMRLGRLLWRIVLCKVAIILVIVKFFLCPDYLQRNFPSDQARAEHVLAVLSPPPPAPLMETTP